MVLVQCCCNTSQISALHVCLLVATAKHVCRCDVDMRNGGFIQQLLTDSVGSDRRPRLPASTLAGREIEGRSNRGEHAKGRRWWLDEGQGIRYRPQTGRCPLPRMHSTRLMCSWRFIGH